MRVDDKRKLARKSNEPPPEDEATEPKRAEPKLAYVSFIDRSKWKPWEKR